MNKTLRDLLAVLVCFCMVCSLCGVGFASELSVSADGDYVLSFDTDLVPFIPDGFQAVPFFVLPAGDTAEPSSEELPFVSAELPAEYAIDPASLAPVTPAGASGLKGVLLSVLGNYDPIVAQYQYNNGSNYSYIREIQPDYVWLCSAAVFAILLYCTWRFLGGLVCKI